MKSRVFLTIALVLLVAVAWIAMRRTDSSPAPLAAPVPESIAQSANTTVLDSSATPASSPATSSRSLAVIPQPSDPSAARTESAKTIILYGFIRGAEWVSDGDQPSVAVFDRTETRTNAEAARDGAYSISGLQPGNYRFNASAGQALKAEGSLNLTLADSPKRLDITLRASPSLLVKVVDEAGMPLTKHELGAIATREPPGEWIDESPNSNPFGLGRFEPHEGKEAQLEPTILGRLILDVDPPLFVSLVNRQRVIDTRAVSPGAKEVEFIVRSDSPLLKEGQLHVRFVDQANQPIEKIWAMVQGGGSMQQMPLEGGVLSTELPPGKWRVRPYAEGFEQHELLVRIDPGADKDLGTVILEPEQWISGTIVEPTKSNTRMSLSCDVIGADGEPELVSGNTTTYGVNADRTFRIGARRRALYLMKYDGRDAGFGVWARIVDTRAGPVENLQVNLVAGVPIMVRPSGDDWHSITFQIADDSGVRYVDSLLWSMAPQRVLLSPGHYKVTARQGSAEPTTQILDVARDGLELRVP